MKLLILITLTLIVVISLPIGLTVVFSKAPSLPIAELPGQFLPGQPLPGGVTCQWQFTLDGVILCDAKVQSQVMYVIYDLREHRIVITGIRALGFSIGDLIAAWGPPTGAKYRNYSTDVYWGKRSAWVYGEFSPMSDLIIIHYHLVEDQATLWRGFVK